MANKTYQEVMASLRKEEAPQEIPEEIPEERGEFREPPQPGSYRFRLPAAIENCFDIIEVAQRDGDGKPIMGSDGKTPVTYQRVNLIFDGPNSLVIAQSPGNKTNGEPFTTRISNIERNRFAGKGVTVKVSDLTYLLRALLPEARPRSNEEFIALLLPLAGRAFGADVEWNGYCNKAKDAYFAFPDEKGGVVYEQAKESDAATENKKGCGLHIYASKWPRGPEGYAPRAQCKDGGIDPNTGHLKCGAWLRPFAQLVRFKA